ncbi:unnamed protein product [Rotaria magnacalcarata]|uniref:Fibronectin type-III domain-containing protein n=3 Tax=Rotaria magnacalcarata TaxID=392030 RepID=A0A819U3Y0_9BILA|nr:unnamed protein product [Rotaria magnacalcarata]CAF2203732.1 unnamed protein product [Rotaria magnacalcarata]CAF4088058.1 unnamed protein product [Rotaria magnacalcarata]
MQQRHLIFIASLFTVISTTEINYFEAVANIPNVPDPVTIYDTLIILWANVTDCPPPSCKCFVQVNVTTYNDTYTVTFSSITPNIGSATVSDLEPDTLYSFSLTCIGTDGNATRLLRTDYGRPSVPRNITVTLVSKRLRISWLPPAVPNGPIHNYKLTKDRETISDEIPNNESSYDMTKDYVYGETDTFFFSACNINRKNETVCSNPNDAISATKINYFGNQMYEHFLLPPLMIFDVTMTLWTNVTDCLSSPCECSVRANMTGFNYTDCAVFSSDTTSIGSALIKDLESDTVYSLTLSCVGTDETVTRRIRTVYGRPSPPRNSTVTLVSKRFGISWLSPSVPNGPIHNYKLANGSKIISG